MNNDIIIVGAGQHCRVVLYNIEMQGFYRPVCILDPNEKIWGKRVNNVFVEPGYHDFDCSFLEKIKKKYATNNFIIGIGAMKLRRSIFNFFIEQGWCACNVIHPDAVVSHSADIGTGVLIEAGCLITPSPTIGNNVVINTGSQVNHDNIVGDHVYIASGVILSGGVKVGENSLIDDGVIISLGRQVGSNCIIGAGSVVTKDIPNNSIAFGVPCRLVRQNNKYE